MTTTNIRSNTTYADELDTPPDIIRHCDEDYWYRHLYPFAERLPIALRLSHVCDDPEEQLDYFNKFEFFDRDGAFLGPCPETGVSLLLDGKPIAEGQVVPELVSPD